MEFNIGKLKDKTAEIRLPMLKTNTKGNKKKYYKMPKQFKTYARKRKKRGCVRKLQAIEGVKK